MKAVPVVIFPASGASSSPSEGDERQEGVGQQEPEDEAEEVRVIVDPGKEPDEEEHGRHADHLEDSHLGVLESRPLVNHLHHAARQEAKVAAGRTDLKK